MVVITYLACLTKLFHYIFLHMIIEKNTIFSSPLNSIDFSFWMFLYVGRLFCLNYACESVSSKVSIYIIYNIFTFIYLLIVNYLFQANEMSTRIHRLTVPFQYIDIHDEVKHVLIIWDATEIHYLALNSYHYMQIYQFMLQIIHHPLKFSGLGLFHFGNGFLRKVRFHILLHFLCTSFSYALNYWYN